MVGYRLTYHQIATLEEMTGGDKDTYLYVEWMPKHKVKDSDGKEVEMPEGLWTWSPQYQEDGIFFLEEQNETTRDEQTEEPLSISYMKSLVRQDMAKFYTLLNEKGSHVTTDQRKERDELAQKLHTFLNAAAGEGFVLDGVDAGDLYAALFRKTYLSIIDKCDSGVDRG